MVRRVVGAGMTEERPGLWVIITVLAGAFVVGFVGGGVVGSLTMTVEPVVPTSSGSPEPRRVKLTVVGASCVREPGVDSEFNPVEYRPEFAIDGDAQTAWQCRGDGAGERLELDLGGMRTVVAVGLIPGYAKTDPYNGTEWYPLNRRLTEVRWHFDGTVISQELDPDPELRDVQLMQLPEPVPTSTLTLEIVSSVPGESSAHPNVAISAIQVMAAS